MAERGMNEQMMKQIQQLQGQIAKAQQALDETTIEASAGGGAVAVVMNAHPKMTSIAIQAEVVDSEDVEMLQDLIMAAVNEALEQIRVIQMRQIAGIAGGLNIPGLTS
jgi:DNA-binding YbaB/EbfC family protein